MTRDHPRLCFLAPNAYPLLAGLTEIDVIGGAEVQQVMVAKSLARRGFSVSMVCLDYGQERYVDIDGVHVIRAFRREAGIPILRFIWPRLAKTWRSLVIADADVYYQRTAGWYTGLMAAFCKRPSAMGPTLSW